MELIINILQLDGSEREQWNKKRRSLLDSEVADTNATMEEQLDTVFAMQSVQEMYNKEQTEGWILH
jgi:hypothetical protein